VNVVATFKEVHFLSFCLGLLLLGFDGAWISVEFMVFHRVGLVGVGVLKIIFHSVVISTAFWYQGFLQKEGKQEK